MTERKLYRCDICRTEYSDPKEAQKCETYHIAPAKGKKVDGTYKGMNVHCCGPYPLKVIVTMADGAKIEYRR